MKKRGYGKKIVMKNEKRRIKKKAMKNRKRGRNREGKK